MRPDGRTFTETARRAQIVAAAVDTLAELGYAQTSLARIAERIGVSKGVISYHFASKEELLQAVFADVLARAGAYVRPRVEAESTARGMLRAMIESNVDFMGEYRRDMVALFEVAVNTRRADSSPNPAVAEMSRETASATTRLLASCQATGEFRADFDPRAMAIAIRAAIDAVPPRLARDPEFDARHYAREVAALFDIATRSHG
jgi:TetR/AcrR family transcriptional regulator, fatty acid metabolism regulator protein